MDLTVYIATQIYTMNPSMPQTTAVAVDSGMGVALALDVHEA